jgi:hypothetical protein
MLSQVPEQKEVYIGINNAECDFDMYLYELMGFGFLERDIGTEKFWKHRTKRDVEIYIQNLNLLKDSCNRVINKLEWVKVTHKEG